MLQLVHGSEDEADCWLYHFFVDHRFQRRGFGSLAMQVFLELVATIRPKSRAVCLTVHPENDAAQRLYVRLGFRPTGEVRDGEPVYRLERGPHPRSLSQLGEG